MEFEKFSTIFYCQEKIQKNEIKDHNGNKEDPNCVKITEGQEYITDFNTERLGEQ